MYRILDGVIPQIQIMILLIISFAMVKKKVAQCIGLLEQ